MVPWRLVEVDDRGTTDLRDQFLDHRLAGQAELADAAVDARGFQLQAEPVGQELLDLLPRQPEAHRQDGDEAGERRTNQAAFAQLQVAPAAFDLRAAAGAGTRDGFLAAGATANEIAVSGGTDLQRHGGAFEIIDVMRTVLPRAPHGTQRRAARRADRRVVIDIASRDHRLTPPEAGHPGPFAGRLRWLRVGCSRRRRAGGIATARVVSAVLSGVLRPLAFVAPAVRVITRRRT